MKKLSRFCPQPPSSSCFLPRLEWLMHEMPCCYVVVMAKKKYCIFSYCFLQRNNGGFWGRLIPIIQSNFSAAHNMNGARHHLHTKARIMTRTTPRRNYCNAPYQKKASLTAKKKSYSLMTQFTTIEDELDSVCVMSKKYPPRKRE